MWLLLWIFGLLDLANAFWMIASPDTWYRNLPARVPDTGPLNVHFVRDIGCAYATIGIVLCVAAQVPAARRALLSVAALFYGLHALLHVADLLAGRLSTDHWLVDAPAVFAPALVLAILCLPRFHRPMTAERL